MHTTNIFFFHFVFLIGFTVNLNSQEEVIYEDHVYVDYIKSVSFHDVNNPTSYPLTSLNNPNRLLLQFDDMGGEFYDYTYHIVHCDRNWKPSEDINEFDYLDGFNGEYIRDYEAATGTQVKYTNYSLTIPNKDLRWRITGNYLLIIKDDQDLPVITRRFMVIDRKVKIEASFMKPMEVKYIDGGQALSLQINNEEFPISNPHKELSLQILQNGRFDNSHSGIRSSHNVGKEIFFRSPDRYFFPAQKEFRVFDIRTLNYAANHVHSIDRHPDKTDVILNLDEDRSQRKYMTVPDANGSFVIQNSSSQLDRNRVGNSDYINPETGDPLSGVALERAILRDQLRKQKSERDEEYANVYFTLNMPRIENQDIYVVGKFNDWKMTEENKMEYSEKNDSYVSDILIKQGYYNYYYAVKTDNKINTEYLEGNWYETENDYLIFAYYRPFSGNYDQIIGYKAVNTLFDSDLRR